MQANFQQTDELIGRVLAGDTEAYSEIVLMYQDRLYHTLVHFTRSPTQAEEYAQEAFIRAYTKLHTFRREANFYTWLFRIAMNIAYADRRKRKVLSLDLIVADGWDPRDRCEGPWAALERAEDVEVVHAALGKLEDREREVLVLRELEGMDYCSISEALQIRIGTVRSRLSRARVRLQEMFR